jgi:hypothetical protein
MPKLLEETFQKIALELIKIKSFKNDSLGSIFYKEELDAIDYFQGTDFYQKYKDPKLKPNIFDTR